MPKGLITVRICSFCTWHLQYRQVWDHAPSGHRLLFSKRRLSEWYHLQAEHGRSLFHQLGIQTVYRQYVFNFLLWQVNIHEGSSHETQMYGTHVSSQHRTFRLSKARYYFPTFEVRMFIHLPGEVRLLEAAQCRIGGKEQLRNSVKNFFESSYPPLH